MSANQIISAPACRRRRAMPARPVVAASLGALAALLALAPAPASAQGPAVAFTSVRDGVARVSAVDASGGATRVLSRLPGAAFEGSPAYSPDGGRIAYTCANFELCVMNAAGGDPVRLTTNDWPRELRYDTRPAWSPDATKIAFVRTVAGQDSIWIVRADGSGLRELPAPAGVNGNPSFSPDGATLAFDHADDETGDGDVPMHSSNRIYAIGVDGSALRRIVGPRGSVSDPAWSPDGRRLAFVREFGDGRSQIVVMNADGSGRRPLTARAAYATGPAWSPDSSRIVFALLGPGGSSLHTIAATGGATTRLTRGGGLDFDPAWQPGVPSPSVAPVPPASAPATTATVDARTVGRLLAAGREILPVLSAAVSARPAALLAFARRAEGLARRITSAARPLRPGSPGAKHARKLLLESADALKAVAGEARAWSRSVRRHDRRVAGKHRTNVVFGMVGVALYLADGARAAGASQRSL
jgi:TolB protein